MNTLIVYLRMSLTVGISLYSTRLVLISLGVIDFGIYNLISGVIVMLSFVNAAMTTSSQRYLSVYQGKKDVKMQRIIFTNSLWLHIIIGVVIIICLQIAGYFLINDFLNMPRNRISAARNVYQLMTITVFFTVIAVPFSGSMNAHENMLGISIINTIEVILKLLVAIILSQTAVDRLIFYGFGMAVVSFTSMLLYAMFCLYRYEECTLKNYKDLDKPVLEELAKFAGWNLFGAACGVGRTQGLAVILNLFIGSTVNAAYAIANQVAGQINFFSAAMLQALNPQIMKSEGEGDRTRMLRLSMMASKFGFFLLAIIAIPCIFEMKSILTFWLTNTPEYTVVFCNLILVSIMTNQLTIGLQSAFQAIGKVKAYQIIVGTALLLNLPIAYLLLKSGINLYSVLLSNILIEMVACVIRLYLLKKIGGLSVNEYFQKVIFKEVFPLITIISIGYFSTVFIQIDNRFILTVVLCMIAFCLSIYFTGLCKDEKVAVNALVRKNKIISKYLSI